MENINLYNGKSASFQASEPPEAKTLTKVQKAVKETLHCVEINGKRVALPQKEGEKLEIPPHVINQDEPVYVTLKPGPPGRTVAVEGKLYEALPQKNAGQEGGFFAMAKWVGKFNRNKADKVDDGLKAADDLYGTLKPDQSHPSLAGVDDKHQYDIPRLFGPEPVYDNFETTAPQHGAFNNHTFTLLPAASFRVEASKPIPSWHTKVGQKGQPRENEEDHEYAQIEGSDGDDVSDDGGGYDRVRSTEKTSAPGSVETASSTNSFVLNHFETLRPSVVAAAYSTVFSRTQVEPKYSKLDLRPATEIAQEMIQKEEASDHPRFVPFEARLDDRHHETLAVFGLSSGVAQKAVCQNFRNILEKKLKEVNFGKNMLQGVIGQVADELKVKAEDVKPGENSFTNFTAIIKFGDKFYTVALGDVSMEAVNNETSERQVLAESTRSSALGAVRKADGIMQPLPRVEAQITSHTLKEFAECQFIATTKSGDTVSRVGIQFVLDDEGVYKAQYTSASSKEV